MRVAAYRIVVFLVRSFITAVGVMLLFAALNNYVSGQVPRIGYFPSVYLTILTFWVVGALVADVVVDADVSLELDRKQR